MGFHCAYISLVQLILTKMVTETKNSSIYSEKLLGFISCFFVSVTTQGTKDRQLEESEEKVDTLPRGSVCTSESDVSDVGEGEGECQSEVDSDSEYNSATEVDTTETETDGEGCVPSKYNQYVLILPVSCVLLQKTSYSSDNMSTYMYMYLLQVIDEQICAQNRSILYSCPSCFSCSSFAMCAKLTTQ